MKKLLYLLLLVSSAAFAQPTVTNQLQVKDFITLKGIKVTDILQDTNFISNNKIPTALQIKNFVAGRLASFTPGSVTDTIHTLKLNPSASQWIIDHSNSSYTVHNSATLTKFSGSVYDGASQKAFSGVAEKNSATDKYTISFVGTKTGNNYSVLEQRKDYVYFRVNDGTTGTNSYMNCLPNSITNYSESGSAYTSMSVTPTEWKVQMPTGDYYMPRITPEAGQAAYCTGGHQLSFEYVPTQSALDDTSAALRAAIAAGGGGTSGALIAANNFSDVPNKATARTNLVLGNVNNTSDINKPTSIYQAAAIHDSISRVLDSIKNYYPGNHISVRDTTVGGKTHKIIDAVPTNLRLAWPLKYVNDTTISADYSSDSGLIRRTRKEFVCTLTQEGSTSTVNVTSGSLIPGVTYYIVARNGSDNFTNVGAFSNTTHTYFIATGTTPAVWSSGSQLSYDTSAPRAKVLLNEVGNVWWTRSGAGSYTINSNGLFTSNTTVFFSPTIDQSTGTFLQFSYQIIDANQIAVETNDLSGGLSDGWMRRSSFKIEIYN